MPKFQPTLETLEDRCLLSNIVWTNRLTATDKFTVRERGVVDRAILLWENVIEDFNSQTNELHLDITGGSKTRVNLGGRTAGIAFANFLPLATADRTPSGSVIIDANGGGSGWFIDPTPATRSEFKKTITPTHFSNGPAGNDLLSVVLHEIGHVLGLPHFNSSNDLMNRVGITGHRYLPTPRDLRFLADNAGITLKANPNILPKVSFVPQVHSAADESVTQPVIHVVLSAVPLWAISVNYTVTGGAATPDSDYQLASGTITFQPGEYKKQLPLTIVDDAVVDGAFAESIQITLTAASGALLWQVFSVYTYEIYENDF